MRNFATKPNRFLSVDEDTPKVLRSVAVGSTKRKFADDERITPWLAAFDGEPVSSESSSMLGMQSKITNLEKMVESLSSKLSDLEKYIEQDNVEVIEIRDIPYNQAKKEIRQFFKDNHGENYTASDLEEHLKIDFEMALAICSELENEGEIG